MADSTAWHHFNFALFPPPTDYGSRFEVEQILNVLLQMRVRVCVTIRLANY